MAYQWLTVRIAEEKDRRQREDFVRQRLPLAFEEVYKAMAECAAAFANAFGPQAIQVRKDAATIGMTVCEEREGQWRPRAEIEITLDAALPGFRVSRGGESFPIVVGMLPGDKLFYKREDQYLAIEDVTRMVLDRVLFPKLV